MKALRSLLVFLLLFVPALVLAQSSDSCNEVLAPCPTNPKNAYMACVSQDFISQVSGFLPERQRVPDSLINPSDWNANVFYNFSSLASQTGKKVTDFQAYINITILWEGAGYRNQFGYFIFDYKNQVPSIRKDKNGNAMQYKLFTDVSFPKAGDTGACLQSGVSVDIGPFFHGDNVGFVCWPDGYNNPGKHSTLYSANRLNPNKEVQVFMFQIQNKYIIGLEDINPLSSSDRDYNDIVFQFQTGVGATVAVPVLDTCDDPTCGGIGHGICNSTSKTCICSSSSRTTYYGSDCQNVYNCDCDQGTCVGDGVCICDTSKFGADCSSCAVGRYRYPDCKTCDSYCDTDHGETCDAAGNCQSPPPPPKETPYCSTQPFGVASDYLVFVRGAFDGANSDVQGRIAAGGDINLYQYSLAEGLNPNDDDNLQCSSITPPYAAVAGGTFTFSSGNARIGSLVYGDANQVDPSVSSGLGVGCSVVQSNTVLDVESGFDYLFGISDAFSNLKTNGQTFIQTDSKQSLYISAPNSQPDDFNFVFELDPNDLAKANAVVFNNFQSQQIKAIIINIDVDKFTFKDTSFSSILQGSSEYLGSKIIWNFHSATSLTINSIAIPGYILAPNANVKGNNGVVWGSIFANSFEGDLQVNFPVGSEALCIMSDFKFPIGQAPCPPCADGQTGGKHCSCLCSVPCTDPKFADPYGSCDCVCPINNDCSLGQDPNTCLCNGANLPAQGDSCSAISSNSAWASWLSDFQIVTAKDLTLKATRVGGRLAVGGQTTLKRIAVGNELTNSKVFDCASTNGQSVPGVILSNGPIYFKSGSVSGNILHGDFTQLDQYLEFPLVVRQGVVGCSLPTSVISQLADTWNFASAFSSLQSYSSVLADSSRTPTTGQAHWAFDVLTFWGYQRPVETFRVSANDLSNARRIDVINIRSDATIIIDITGTSVSIKDVGTTSLIPFARGLLWNAAQATSFSFKNVALPGLILAPNADISNPVGRLIGGAFVKSFSATGNIAIEWPFSSWSGCLPDVDSLTNTCDNCPEGSRRVSPTNCECEVVFSIAQSSVSIFEGDNGALVTFGMVSSGPRAPSSVTVNFPNDGTCKLQLGDNNKPNVFSLVQINNPSGLNGYTYTTPSYAGFSAASYSFVVVFQSPNNGDCSDVPTPQIVDVSYDPISSS